MVVLMVAWRIFKKYVQRLINARFLCLKFSVLFVLSKSDEIFMHVDKHGSLFSWKFRIEKEKKHQEIILTFFPASSTPTTANSSRHPLIHDSIITITSSEGDTSLSSQNSPSNPLRVSAIRELIDTEQRYVDDLLIVANEFIKPLNNARVLSDYEIEQLFINWYSLIALNSNLLKALHEQVDYKEQNHPRENEVITRTPRSVSMTNIALAAQVCNIGVRIYNILNKSPPIRRSSHWLSG